MLKISSTNGKFNVSFAEENPFQQETIKSKDKFDNRSTKRLASRASAAIVASQSNKQLTKPPTSTRQLHGKHKKNLRALNKSGTEALEKRTTFSRKGKGKVSKPSSVKLTSQQNLKHESAAGFITQNELQNILSVDSTNHGRSSLTKDQLSLLLTLLKKDQVLANAKTESHEDSTKELLNQTTEFHSKHTGSSPGEANDEKPAEKNDLVKDEAQVTEKRKIESKEHSKVVGAVEEYYNPWGRPGAGAPIRNQSGNVVADFRKMHDVGSSIQFPGAGANTAPTSVAVSTVGSSTVNYSTSIPVALRSSFAVGAPGIVSQDTKPSKAEEHKKYLQELDKQIQEKKERDRQQKLREQREEQNNMTWSQPIDKPKTSPKPQVNIAGPPVVTQTQANPLSPGLNTSNSSMMFGSASAAQSLSPRSHARGHGMHTLDLQSQEEAERKRQKMLEHQRAIQEQVEEKRRIKQQQKEQKMREEALEEARLARERELIKQQHELDLRKQKEKEEEAKRRNEALQQSVLQAYEEAQKAKNKKLIKHLESAGHDVSKLRPGSNGATSRSYVIDARGVHLEPNPSVMESAPAETIVSPEEDKLSQTDMLRLSEEYNAILSKDTDHKQTSSSYDDHSSFKIEATHRQAPPLELERKSNSPPVPAVRRKLRAQSPKRSPREKQGKGNRTDSSLSEPNARRTKNMSRSYTLRNKAINKVKRAGTPIPCKPEVEEDLPLSNVEDAFMVPYLRTTSATLPPPPDTPATNQSSVNSKPSGKVDRYKNARNERAGGAGRGEDLAAVNRHKTAFLKANQHEERTRKPKQTKDCQKSTVNPKETSKEKTRETKGSDERSVQTENSTLREDSPLYLMPLVPSARQEMILKQLAALREGLMIKEREYQRAEI